MLRTQTTLGLVLMALAGCATAPPPLLLHNHYRVIQTNQIDEVEATERFSSPFKNLARTLSSGDIFAGTDRRDPKTSVATGGLKSYPTIAALRSSFPTDDFMKGLGITRAPDSQRTTQEQYNVTVAGYIYAASKESDNDFHLILGDKGCATGDCLINVEVSGLPQDPADPSYPTLSAVRTKFLSYLNQQQPARGYETFSPPIAVIVTGSVFFDVDHPAGAVGPTGLKPSSAWEIHPLTEITFEPGGM
ncbi:MAG: hypothetical protein M3N91_07145 [Pseudomonadota bacterium]|nr:hypothetical protein [Pseudomonadota bacterium]